MTFRIALILLLLCAAASQAATRKVGPHERYHRPCEAVAEARDGDQILIDAAGTYDGDVCVITKNRLTLRGVNGRPRLNAAGKSAEGKGIWVIRGNATLVENIEFTGARVVDHNGAGIRQEGLDLTVRNCYFHNNEAGILTGASGRVVVEFCEFAENGHGDGQSHNIYVNHANVFIMRFCYSHNSIGGQIEKSRAATNYILFNRLTDEGGSNYQVDLPNGGLSYVIGNVIQKSATSTNHSAILCYLVEGSTPLNPEKRLFVVNNTFVNDGIPDFRFIWLYSPTTALIQNNIFTGPGVITNQAATSLVSNFSGDPHFRQAVAHDYHLLPDSPAIGAGSPPGEGTGFDLTPGYEYVHPACGRVLGPIANLDIGAFQSGGSRTPVSAQPGRCTP